MDSPKKVFQPLEDSVEGYLTRRVKQEWPGSYCIKFQKRHWPDRLLLLPGQIVFVETKRPKKKPRKGQDYILRQLQGLGVDAVWADTREKIDELIDRLKEGEHERR